MAHPAPLLTPPPPRGHELGVIVLIFGASDSCGPFTQNILPGKNRMKNCPLEGPQSGTVRFEKKYFLSNISGF